MHDIRWYWFCNWYWYKSFSVSLSLPSPLSRGLDLFPYQHFQLSFSPLTYNLCTWMLAGRWKCSFCHRMALVVAKATHPPCQWKESHSSLDGFIPYVEIWLLEIFINKMLTSASLQQRKPLKITSSGVTQTSGGVLVLWPRECHPLWASGSSALQWEWH